MHPEHTTRPDPSQSTHVTAPSYYQEPPIEGPDVLQQMRQRQVLARAHPKHPLPGFGDRSGPPKLGWFLPGATRARESASSLDVLRSVEWVAVRRGVAWSENDQTANDALVARCFDYHYIERRRIETRPTWLETLCRDQWATEDGPGFPAKSGFLCFLTDLLHARRVGAIGAILSQADAGTLYQVTPRHWRRWMEHAESMGMVRILQLWQRDPTRRRHRGHWRMCYMLGHSIVERAGVALYEGLDRNFGNGRPMKPAAAAAAKRLRAKRREANRARHDELWRLGCSSDVRATRSGPPFLYSVGKSSGTVRATRSGPSSLSPDMMSGPTLLRRVTGDSIPCVSPEGEISIASDIAADVSLSRESLGGGGKSDCVGAPMASPSRSSLEPTANTVEPARDTVRGADRLGRGVNASSTKTPFPGGIGAMLANYTDKLRRSLLVFLFFLVSNMVGCREKPDQYVAAGLGTTETSETTSSGGSTWGSSSLGSGGEHANTLPGSTKSGSSSDAGSSVEEESSEITDDTGDPETSETGPIELWEDVLLRDACVFQCVADENESERWCESQTWADPVIDQPFCVYLAMDAVLFRCGEACECRVGCE